MCNSSCKIMKEFNTYILMDDKNQDIHDSKRSVNLVFNLPYYLNQENEYSLWEFKIEN